MGKCRKYIAVVLAFVVALSLAVPASAADYQSQYNFWNWAYDNSWFLGKAIIGFAAGNVCQVSEDGLHHASTHSAGFSGGGRDGERVYNCVCDLCGQEFQATHSDLKTTYENHIIDNKTVSVNNSGYYGYFDWYWNDLIVDVTKTAQGIDYVTYYYPTDRSVTLATWCLFTVNDSQLVTVTVPFSYTDSLIPDAGAYFNSSVSVFDETTHKAVTLKSGENCYCFDAVAGHQYGVTLSILNAKSRYDVDMTGQYETIHVDYPSILFTYDVDVPDRPNTFAPSFNYNDGSGNVVSFDKQLIDETNLTYYNPVTNTTTNIQNWSYDYSDRSYTVVTDSNNTYIITYGDEYITIDEGDNIVYNIYYYDPVGDSDDSGSSDGSGGSSDDSDGLLGKLGELLGTLLGGLIDLVSGVLSGIMDGLISLVSMTIEKLGSVVNLFGEFGNSLKLLWSWLPEEIVTILAAGVSVVVLASVLMLFI